MSPVHPVQIIIGVDRPAPRVAAWLVAVFLMLALSSPVWGASMLVTTLSDSVSTDGECSLREAMLNAEGANQSGSTDCPAGSVSDNLIQFAPMLIGGSIDLVGGELPRITRNLELRGPVEGDPQGLGLNANLLSRIVSIGDGAVVIVSDMTLANGWTNSVGESGATLAIEGGAHVTLLQLRINGSRAVGTGSHGGAISVADSTLTIKGSELVDIQAAGDGGIVAAFNSALDFNTTSLTLGAALGRGGALFIDGGEALLSEMSIGASTTVSNNGSGGAIHVQNADLDLVDSQLFSNRTQGSSARGGALYLSGGHLNLVSSSLSGNRTERELSGGGGLALFSATASLIDCQIDDNRTEGDGGSGGGMFLSNVNLDLLSCRLSDNRTQGVNAHGGGLYAFGGQLTLDRIEIRDNQTLAGSTRGGGLALLSNTALIEASTIAGNLSQQRGGGLAIDTGALTLINSTVSGNSLGSGSGAAIDGDRSPIELRHVTVAGNDNAPGQGSDSLVVTGTPGEPGSLQVDNSLLVDEVCTAGPDALLTVNRSVGTDASCATLVASAAQIGLQPLALNGGPTRTHAVLPPSLALNAAGDCLADLGIASDQRGQPRPGGAAALCDAGAFEYNGPPGVDLTLALSTSAGPVTPGDQISLTVALSNVALDAASDIGVELDLDAGLALLSGTPSAGSFDPVSRTWTLPALAAQAAASMEIQIEVLASRQLGLTVIAEASEPELDPIDNSASTTLALADGVMVVDTLADNETTNGFCSLREALRNAALTAQPRTDCSPGLADGNEIFFDAALSGGTILMNGNSFISIQRDLRIHGLPDTLGLLTIDGNEQSRIFSISGDVEVIMSDLTLRNGRTDDTGESGGIVLIESGAEVRFERVSFVDGNAAGIQSRGGALAVFDSTLNLDRVHLLGNQSSVGAGAVHAVASSLEVTNVLALGNAALFRASAFFVQDSSVVLQNVVFEANVALTTDIVTAFRAIDSTSLLEDIVISDHLSGQTNGLFVTGGNLSLHRCRIEGNQPSGGSVVVIEAAQFAVEQCLFKDNLMTGGERAIQIRSGAEGRLVNVTFSGNRNTSNVGAALRVDNAELDVIHATFAEGQPIGSDVFVFAGPGESATLRLINSLLVGVRCQQGGAGTLIAVGSLSTEIGCTQVITPPELLPIEPLTSLDSFEDTYPLAAGSLALDAAGDCVGDYGVSVDQRGAARPQGAAGACDVGAYEAIGVPGDRIFGDRFESSGAGW
jgi:CSLREA domain-containing protein